MSDPVRELISGALKVPADSIEDSMAYQDIPEWDSMGHLDLILRLEEQLGVAISDAEVPKLTTVGAIRAFVGDRLGS